MKIGIFRYFLNSDPTQNKWFHIINALNDIMERTKRSSKQLIFSKIAVAIVK